MVALTMAGLFDPLTHTPWYDTPQGKPLRGRRSQCFLHPGPPFGRGAVRDLQEDQREWEKEDASSLNPIADPRHRSDAWT